MEAKKVVKWRVLGCPLASTPIAHDIRQSQLSDLGEKREKKIKYKNKNKNKNKTTTTTTTTTTKVQRKSERQLNSSTLFWAREK